MGIGGSILNFTYTQVSSLNETEAQVYNYVMMNRDKVMDESIRELAHDTHVSTATVIRFCKKMGCSGFLEFKYKLKDHIHAELIKAKQDSTNFMSFVAYTTTKQYQDGIQRVAEIIQNADNFFVLGLRHCADFSIYIARKFSHIGYYCYGFVDNLYPAQDVPEGETSVIMIYDKSLEDLIFEEIRKYKSKHYQVILLSCENVGAMEHLCDDVIYVADGKVKLGSLTSGVPMLYAVERIVGILTKDEIEN